MIDRNPSLQKLTTIKLTTIKLIKVIQQVLVMSKIIDSANDLAQKFSMLSNAYRILIIMYLSSKKRATWTDIKQFVEKNVGSVNPNTLHFHLKALTEIGYVVRSGGEDKTTYELGKVPDYIVDAVKKFPSISHINKEMNQ
jgi:DNA-binding HxlR family transcriptional regulator